MAEQSSGRSDARRLVLRAAVLPTPHEPRKSSATRSHSASSACVAVSDVGYGLKPYTLDPFDERHLARSMAVERRAFPPPPTHTDETTICLIKVYGFVRQT
jgi:hypothetical protein